MDPVKQHIIRIGRAMMMLGFQNTHSGNISVRFKDEMYITKTGSMKGHLEERDICKPGLFEPAYGLFQASSETGQHRTVLHYAGAMIHAHTFPAVLLSYIRDVLEPIDAFGRRFLPRVPVVEFEFPVGSPEMERDIPKVLKTVPAMIVKTHGPFVRGNDLDEAFFLQCLLQHSAEILYNLELLSPDRERRIPDTPPVDDYQPLTGRSDTTDRTLRGQFVRTARDLFYLRLSPFLTGMLSVANGREMLYSPALSLPDGFDPDIVRIGIADESDSFMIALQQAVYRNSSAKAALFTLSPEAMVEGLGAWWRGEDRIIPADAEGGYLYPAIPVVAPDEPLHNIVEKAVRYKLVVVPGFGVLSIGHTPGHAIHHNSSLKNICHFLVQLRLMQKLGSLEALNPLLCGKGREW